MERIRPITRKVNAIIVLSLTVGIGAVIVFLALRTNRDLQDRTLANLRLQSEVIFQAVKNVMLDGEAPLAVELMKDIRGVNPTYEIKLYRSTGIEAFSDNSTIQRVNANIGTAAFQERVVPFGTASDLMSDEKFIMSVEQARRQWERRSVDGRDSFIIYSPLLNNPKCSLCHGPDHTIRGVIRIRSDITELVRQQITNLTVSGSIFVAVVIILTLVLTFFLHNAIIGPVKEIGGVCTTVTGGDFDVRVSVKSHDEIGALGDTVNEMIQGLYERFQLSKFVSTSTLQSISTGHEGARAELTLFFSDIRSFTAYADTHPPELVIEILNRVLNYQTEAILQCGGDIDKYVGDEVFALFSGPEQATNACRAALQIQREIFGRADDLYGGLHVGIGINTGEVILGMIGSERRADHTVIGDHVNFASRLCSAAKPGEIIVAERTMKTAGDGIKGRGPLKVTVKGKRTAQLVYMLQEEV